MNEFTFHLKVESSSLFSWCIYQFWVFSCFSISAICIDPNPTVSCSLADSLFAKSYLYKGTIATHCTHAYNNEDSF